MSASQTDHVSRGGAESAEREDPFWLCVLTGFAAKRGTAPLVTPLDQEEFALAFKSPTVVWVGRIPVSYTHLTLPTNREV